MMPPGPVWSPGARLAGFIKRTTIHCYTQNMKALGLVVSEKIFFLCFSHDAPGAGPVWTPGARMDHRGTVVRIYKEDHYTLLHTKHDSSGPCGFGEEDFFMFFPLHVLWELMTPGAGPFFDPRGMVGRIYKEDHYTSLHTKYESSGPCDFGEEDFFKCFSHDAPRAGPQGHRWQDL